MDFIINIIIATPNQIKLLYDRGNGGESISRWSGGSIGGGSGGIVEVIGWMVSYGNKAI